VKVVVVRRGKKHTYRWLVCTYALSLCLAIAGSFLDTYVLLRREYPEGSELVFN
jgi:hypothetical protein